MDLILASANRPFAVAIGVMLALALIEAVFLAFGQGLSDTVDGLLPEHDVLEGSAVGGALTFFGIGSVPILVVFIAFLTIFGLTGFLIQAIVNGISGSYLPALVAILPAGAVATLGTRRFATTLGRLIPNVETTAVDSGTFVGRTAVIIRGHAKTGQPTEARLRDEHGQIHYVLVEPETDGSVLSDGETVLIVGRRGHLFLAIAAPSAALNPNPQA